MAFLLGVEQTFTERFPISHLLCFQVFCPQSDQQGGFDLPPSSPWFPCILSPKREVRQRWVTVHFIVLTRSINRTRSSTQLHLQFHSHLTSDILHLRTHCDGEIFYVNLATTFAAFSTAGALGVIRSIQNNHDPSPIPSTQYFA